MGSLEMKVKDRAQCRLCREKSCSQGSDHSYACPWFNYPGSYTPCKAACPAGVNSDIYVDLISQGKFKEALEVHRQTMPFAGVCGRICTHPCEVGCERFKVDGPVSIRSLKRFMADYELKVGREKAVPIKKTKADKVAVIGSGPAGLACAYDMVKQGYSVTVFETAHLAGGLLRYGIPEYRLPKKILDNEISFIEELGVEIKTNTKVKNFEDIFGQGYKAIFFGVGAGANQKLGIPSENSGGVIHALDFLKQVNLGTEVGIGKKVIVIGGGCVGIDSARTSLRLGAKEVHLVCLETRDLASKDRMPAQDREIKEAEEEGIIIHPSLGVSRILTENGKITGLETTICISVRDENGQFAPKFKKESGKIIEGDNVIVAIGQAVDKAVLPQELKCTDVGNVIVNPITLQTNIEGVFAGGDVVTGRGNVIDCIAEGKEAAVSIDLYLTEQDLIEGRPPRIKQVEGVAMERLDEKRDVTQVIAPEKRGKFEEVQLSFSEKMATDEAGRCLKCGAGMDRNIYCGMCTECLKACPHDNISLRTRFFGKDLLKHRKMDEAYKSFIMLGAGLLFATIFFGWWGNLKELADPLESTLLQLPLNWSEWGLYVLLVWSSMLVVLPGIHLLFCWLAKVVVKAREVPLKKLFVDYAYCLIPIGLAVWMSFGIGLLMVQGSMVVSSISDPLGWGWDLFGTADFPWTPFAPHLVPFIQAAFLFIGLAGGTYVGWKLSLQNFGTPGKALKAMVPIVVFLLGLTILIMKVFAIV